MALFPVIMCGGAGTRLWPASRPSRPKQFIPLAGNRSLFQDTASRVVDLARDGGRLIVIGSVAHRQTIGDQLLEIGVDAQVLLEPQARDSAAAMAAAAAWVLRHDPEGVIVVVASDHYIPDAAAFRDASLQAAEGARAGKIVTLGVKPTEASSAYGYIKPAGRGLSAVETFCEKPDSATAAAYIEAGYMWNSGNFIVTAATLAAELTAHAPAVQAAAVAALPPEDGQSVQVFGDVFSEAPKISIDYAVMEKTRLASVLEVDFSWSDLGAWDAIAASGEGDTGIHIFEDAEHCLARAPDGVLVAALGVQNIGIIVEPDAVLVCDLSKSQDVKKLVERIRTTSPKHLDFTKAHQEDLAAGAQRFADWLRLRALPSWATLGFGADGGFAESLTLNGRPVAAPRRARVQARQIFVYGQAGAMGWDGPWRPILAAALNKLYDGYLKPDGFARTLLAADGSPLDETAMLYDQAFVLFALSAAKAAGVDDPTIEVRAARLRDGLLAAALPNGAMKEAGEQPFQSNAHMHLLEACLAWETLSDDAGWSRLTDQIATLSMNVFIDSEGGFLREFFDEDWNPAAGDDGRLVEPGHQFEWAWLLTRYAVARDDARALAAAKKLYAIGRLGIDEHVRIALDAMNDDLTVRSHRARLWPQTEWLKASLILSQQVTDGERTSLLADAASAQRALWLYLTPDGFWRDKRLADGEFIDEPAPASSFYHIIAAFMQLSLTGQALDLDGMNILDLA